MKLVIAIVQADDTKRLQKAFVKNNIRSTKLATTGSFLSEGNATFIVGTADKKVPDVLRVIQKESKSREEYASPGIMPSRFQSAKPVKVIVGGAIVFVLPVDEFKKY